MSSWHPIQVNTVEGESDLQVPQGTQPGDVVVLARKGAPKLNKPSIRGDHLFTIKVTIPKRIRYEFAFLKYSISSVVYMFTTY